MAEEEEGTTKKKGSKKKKFFLFVLFAAATAAVVTFVKKRRNAGFDESDWQELRPRRAARYTERDVSRARAGTRGPSCVRSGVGYG